MFIRLIFTILLAFSMASLCAGQDRHQISNRALLDTLIEVNDGVITREMMQQVTARGTRYEGALLDNDSVVSPIRTAQFIQTLISGYVSKKSKYYRSGEVLIRMTQAARALVELQHDDGTIDLLTTNFHSTPDLGFTVLPLAVSYSIMLNEKGMSSGALFDAVKKYLLKAGDALSVGGIHTPNHRWVVSAALAWLDSFFHDPKYKARIDQWLAEKVDIDPDGQYHERSTAIYTPVTNRCLIDIARKIGYDHLYDAIRRNLDMTLYLIHTNGEIATESSRRRDKYERSDLSKYYLAYNQLALIDTSSRYAGMVAYIRETVPVDHLLYMLPLLIEDPTMLHRLPSPSPPETRYHKHFKYSDMVRVRDGGVDISIIKDNPTFLTFFKGDAALEGIRLSSAFFGKGQFVGQEMEAQNDSYVLSSSLDGPYYQPLPKDKIPDDTDAWSAVPRTERERSEVQKLFTKVVITPKNGKATIAVIVDGPENLPVTLELGFRSGGTLENVIRKDGVENAFLAKDGQKVIYRYGDDAITISPATRLHKWTQLRGALPKMDADCVYFTNYAPCRFEFTIE